MARKPRPSHLTPTESTVKVPEAKFEPDPPQDRLPLGPMPVVSRWRDELDRELVELLCVAAEVGGFKKQSALACGVKPETLEWWLSEGMRSDAPELMQELSARFQSIQQNCTLGLVAVIRRAAMLGEWEAAFTMLKHRDPLWSGNEKSRESETAPPTSSLESRYSLLVEELKSAKENPTGDLARALRAAGLLTEGPGTEESSGLHALLSAGKPEGDSGV